MKFIAISIAGFIGGAVFSFLGWLSQDSLKSAPAQGQHVTAYKPAVPAKNDDLASSSNLGLRDSLDELNDASANLTRKVSLLERGQDFLQKIPDYTTTLTKQEVVNGELLEPQTVLIKCRQRPFSVYLLWLAGDVGREVIYVDGGNNGKMVAHDGGWKARIPAFTLPVDCMLAMRDSRYPVTMAGLAGLTEIMLGVHKHDLAASNYASCELDENQSVEGRPCYLFTTRYKSKDESPCYRKSTTWIDKQWSVPLISHHYEWPRTDSPDSSEEETDQATLLESYSFANLRFHQELGDDDFDRDNDGYHFR